MTGHAKKYKMNRRFPTQFSPNEPKTNLERKMLYLVLESSESGKPALTRNSHIIDGTRIVAINSYIYLCPPAKKYGQQTQPCTLDNGSNPRPPFILVEFPAYQECEEILGFLCAISGLNEILDVSYEYHDAGHGKISATAFELRKHLHPMLFEPIERLGLRKATVTALRNADYSHVWQIEQRFAQVQHMHHPHEFAADNFATKMQITEYLHSKVWEASVIDIGLYGIRFARTREIAQALIDAGLPLGINFTARQLMRLVEKNGYL